MFTTDATNLPRVINCNGSRNMPASFPAIDLDPTSRDEGNAAHWLAQNWFNGTVDPTTVIGTKADNGVIITAEMHEHVGDYLASLNAGAMETTTSYGTDTWRVNGRCDHWVYEPNLVVGYINGGNGNVIEDTETCLTVDDFKYGRSLVEAEMNWTLISHAVGLCLFNGFAPRRIVLRIHQPRAYHPEGQVREWVISYDQLMELYAQIAATMSNPSNELRTGLDWCRKCHALATCPAARKARMNITDATSMAFSDELPDEALAYELSTIENAKAMLDAQYDALKELVGYRARNGHVLQVPNSDMVYCLEHTYANTRWKQGITPEALTLTTGINCIKTSAITPAEFKRRGGNEALVPLLTERPLTGNKLVRVSADKRAKRLLGK